MAAPVKYWEREAPKSHFARISFQGFRAANFFSRFIYGPAWRNKRKKEYS